ncbi:AI-2E family transporter [Parvularcula lutaonensis]|uniref:AI-2E family transporter n=1 Tax=Parvularcula lutaonensis TaxID=491923 RepID=A0ABV7MCT5_9PROT|nr:AI-2E family transporter [Parvularcula lutaonensis]GGY51639.1 AI-2E family transporter [Parvularcula lutaonensis]
MTTPVVGSVETGAKPRRSLPALFNGAGLFVMVGFVLWIGQGVLIPLVIAAFLSFLIVTVKRRIERLPVLGALLPEGAAFTLAFAAIVFVLFVLVAIIRTNIEAVIAAAPSYNARLVEIWSGFNAYAMSLPGIGPDLESALDTLQDNAIAVVQGYLGNFASIASGAIGSLVTVLLYTAFMLVERGQFMKKVTRIAGPHGAERLVSDVIDDIGRLVREYISVKTLTSLMVAMISFIIMTFLSIDFAGFWALLIFALNFIPVIGSIIAVMLPTVLALVQPGGGVTLFILTGVLLTTAQQVVGSLIEPRMMGRSLNLSPLVILLSLASWGSLWGIAGMFLCVPMTVAMMIILAQFDATRPVAILLSDDGEVEPLKRGESR